MKRFYDLPAGLNTDRSTMRNNDDEFHFGSVGGIFDLEKVQSVGNLREDRHRTYFEINMGSDSMYYSTTLNGCTKQVMEERRMQAQIIRESVINAWVAYHTGNDTNILDQIITTQQ